MPTVEVEFFVIAAFRSIRSEERVRIEFFRAFNGIETFVADAVAVVVELVDGLFVIAFWTDFLDRSVIDFSAVMV